MTHSETPRDSRNRELCTLTLGSLMLSKEPAEIIRAAGLFRGDFYGQPDQLDRILRTLGALASEGILVSEHGPEPLIVRLVAESDDRECWEIIVNQIRQQGGNDPDYRWYLKEAHERTIRWRMGKLGEAAMNGMRPGEIRGLLGKLIAEATACDATPGLEPLQGLDLSAPLRPVPDPLVGNGQMQLIMPGEAVLIASDSGVGKTKALTAIALGVSSGRGILELPCQRRPVAYITSDPDPDFLRNLQRQWMGMGGRIEELNNLPLFAKADADFNLEDDSCFARLRVTLERLRAKETPSLFILECISSNVLTTDLNDQVSVRQYVRSRIRGLMEDFPGLTTIVSHHLRKTQQGAGNGLGDRVAGSMQLRASFDAAIGLVPAGKDSFTMRRIKRSRSGGDFEAFRVSIVDSDGRGGPLVLGNEGTLEIGTEEARGAAGAVRRFYETEGMDGRSILLEKCVKALEGKLRERAIQAAAKKLSETNPPILIRREKKPAAYSLAPIQDRFEELG